jgi:hypothetical protein
LFVILAPISILSTLSMFGAGVVTLIHFDEDGFCAGPGHLMYILFYAGASAGAAATLLAAEYFTVRAWSAQIISRTDRMSVIDFQRPLPSLPDIEQIRVDASALSSTSGRSVFDRQSSIREMPESIQRLHIVVVVLGYIVGLGTQLWVYLSGNGRVRSIFLFYLAIELSVCLSLIWLFAYRINAHVRGVEERLRLDSAPSQLGPFDCFRQDILTGFRRTVMLLSVIILTAIVNQLYFAIRDATGPVEYVPENIKPFDAVFPYVLLSGSGFSLWFTWVPLSIPLSGISDDTVAVDLHDADTPYLEFLAQEEAQARSDNVNYL